MRSSLTDQGSATSEHPIQVHTSHTHVVASRHHPLLYMPHAIHVIHGRHPFLASCASDGCSSYLLMPSRLIIRPKIVAAIHHVSLEAPFISAWRRLLPSMSSICSSRAILALLVDWPWLALLQQRKAEEDDGLRSASRQPLSGNCKKKFSSLPAWVKHFMPSVYNAQ